MSYKYKKEKVISWIFGCKGRSKTMKELMLCFTQQRLNQHFNIITLGEYFRLLEIEYEMEE